MTVIYEANFKNFGSSVVHEAYYIMQFYKNKKEEIFTEYNSESSLLNSAQNLSVIAYDKKTKEIKGFSWCLPKIFIKRQKYFMYSYFVRPDVGQSFAKRLISDGFCKFAFYTQQNMKNYTIENNLDYKGLYLVAINKKLDKKFIEDYGGFKLFEKQWRNKNVGYFNFDGSKINNQDFYDWCK